MSLNCSFGYSVPRDSDWEIIPNGFEVEETNTQYLNWIMELMPEDYQRVNGFAPFLKQIYDQLSENGYWADFGTDPFEPEQARLWAAWWLDLWQANTKDEEVQTVKQNWSDYTDRIIRVLRQVIEQSECAKRHGVLLGFPIG